MIVNLKGETLRNEGFPRVRSIPANWLHEFKFSILEWLKKLITLESGYLHVNINVGIPGGVSSASSFMPFFGYGGHFLRSRRKLASKPILCILPCGPISPFLVQR